MVFGAAGFVGSAVYGEMLAEGLEAVPVYHTPDGRDGYRVDLADAAAVCRLVDEAQPEAIVNCAGSVAPGQPPPPFATFSQNILHAVRTVNPKLIGNIVIVGSAGVYGEPERFPVHEDDRLAPNTAYTWAKYDEEKTARELADRYDLPLIIARCFNLTGPGLPDRLMLSQVMAALRKCQNEGSEVPLLPVNQLYGKRDFLSVRDGARAIVALASRRSLLYDTYNVGSSIEMTNAELVRLALEEFGYDTIDPADVVPTKQPQPCEIPGYASQADIRRMEGIGWTSTGIVGLRKAIHEMHQAKENDLPEELSEKAG